MRLKVEKRLNMYCVKVNLGEELHKELVETAKFFETNKSQIIRRALIEHFENNGIRKSCSEIPLKLQD